ncbi:MAG: sugar phosphate isomerase/epimerase [Clostridia bacterium]|nr:sugar phosphate isomerase/epimerase [Clostridia bacterium]
MWKQKLGISLGNHYAIPTPDVVTLVGNTGFDAISPEWEPEADLGTIVNTARDRGLALQSLHAPFGRAADMWNPDPSVHTSALQEVLAALEAAAKYEIPVLVVHTWIGFEYDFDAACLWFGAFDALVARAGEVGVTVAFENTEGQEYLFALMEHFKGESAVGFCWDSGHELCYNHSLDLLGLFGDRLAVTHLNDNLGISRFDGTTFWTDDLHLLPYDGIADWADNVARLKTCRKLEYLNFELGLHSKPGRHENDGYGKLPLEEYFAEAYKRACRIAWNYAK